MNKESIKIICNILEVEEEDYISSYLNEDNTIQEIVSKVLQKYSIKGEELTSDIARRLSEETNMTWIPITKEKFSKPSTKSKREVVRQTWFTCPKMDASIFFCNKGINDINLSPTDSCILLDTQPSIRKLANKSYLYLIRKKKEKIISDLKDITNEKRRKIESRIDFLETKLTDLQKEREIILQEQEKEEKETKEYLENAAASRKKLKEHIAETTGENIPIREVLRVASKLNPIDEIEKYGDLLSFYNKNHNIKLKKDFIYTCEITGINGTIEKKVPSEILELVEFYQKKFASVTNIPNFLKYITRAGYQTFRNNAKELERLVQKAQQVDLTDLDVDISELKESLQISFNKKLKGLSEEELETRFNNFWNRIIKSHTEPDKSIVIEITGYIKYMNQFSQATSNIVNYINIYRFLSRIDPEIISKYQKTNSLVEYKKNILARNTSCRTYKLTKIARDTVIIQEEIAKNKAYLSKMIEEESTLLSSTNKENMPTPKVYIKTNDNKE